MIQKLAEEFHQMLSNSEANASWLDARARLAQQIIQTEARTPQDVVAQIETVIAHCGLEGSGRTSDALMLGAMRSAIRLLNHSRASQSHAA